jgi:UDP-GlcNAc:undecaprenyl-phosphate GlcNAc-1-phosphate transferase
MPLCVLAIPLYDLVSVTAIRIAQGKSPFVGDQQHFSHRLRARGLSVRRTLALICGVTALTGIGGLILGRVNGPVAAFIGAQTLLIVALLALYEHGSRVHRQDAKSAEWKAR